MKRLTIIALAVAATCGLLANSTYAQNPHCIRTSASIDNAGNLVVNFKLAGFGSGQTVNVSVNTDACATYACQNKGGNCPSAANKHTTQGPISGSTTVTTGRTGQARGSITLEPPSDSSLSCPPGQRLRTVCVTYAAGTLSFDGGSCSFPSAGSANLFPDCPGLCDCF